MGDGYDLNPAQVVNTVTNVNELYGDATPPTFASSTRLDAIPGS